MARQPPKLARRRPCNSPTSTKVVVPGITTCDGPHHSRGQPRYDWAPREPYGDGRRSDRRLRKGPTALESYPTNLRGTQGGSLEIIRTSEDDPLPRSRFENPSRGAAVFLDRRDQLRLVQSHLDLMNNDPAHFRVFEIIGLGGVGKTRLLNEVRRHARDQQGIKEVLWVGLEAEASNTETGPLRALRDQLSFDCLLFDTAILTYGAAVGQPAASGASRGVVRSVAYRSVELAGPAALGIPLPVTFAADIYRFVSRRVGMTRRYGRNEFEAIDDLRRQPNELRKRLPHYFGLDIQRRLTASRRGIIIFFDGYENQAATTLLKRSPWLREFVGTLSRGIHVVSTREPLGWTPADWDDVTQTVIIGELPEPESRRMTRDRLGEVPAAIEELLLRGSRQIPFFLEAGIDAYELEDNSSLQRPGPAPPVSRDFFVKHLVDHLERPHQDIAVALASVQVFDRGLYEYLIQALHIPISVLQFDEFLEWFFVAPLGDGMFKTHDILTEFVRQSSDYTPARNAALAAATRHLSAVCMGSDLSGQDSYLRILHALLSGWLTVESMPVKSTEALIDAAFRLHDAGYWNELARLTETISSNADHDAAIVARLFFALSSRRTAGPEAALAQLEGIEDHLGRLGRHQRAVEVEAAYLSEISGNYTRARLELHNLDRSAVPFDPTERSHLRARLYNADMLVMDGRFIEASRLLLEASELVGLHSPLDWAELVRHRGHAFRFSFLLEEAEHLYLQALRSCVGAPAMIGKLQTNLAETYCWSDPNRALKAAESATELNLKLGNRIEIAKCDAARAIALAKKGEYRAAEDAALRASAEAEGATYPAGLAFALQAVAISAGIEGQPGGLRRALAALRSRVDALGTYGHLCAPAAWLTYDDEAFVEAAFEVDWIDARGIEGRFRRYLGGPPEE